MRQKTIGIRDVAREAGVSVTTVSHILNNKESARASDETRERVRATAARLGYGPNRMARSLRMQRSEMIGLLSEDIATTPHAGRIILGAQDAAGAVEAVEGARHVDDKAGDAGGVVLFGRGGDLGGEGGQQPQQRQLGRVGQRGGVGGV